MINVSQPSPATLPTGDDFEAATAAMHVHRPLRSARLRQAAVLVSEGRVGPAIESLDEFLEAHPQDADALYIRAEAALRSGSPADAEGLLARCADLAPDFTAARFSLANLSLQINKPGEALVEVEKLLQREPQNPLFRRLKASALESMEDFSGAAGMWRDLVDDYPDHLDCAVRYGHALRSLGQREEAVAAYREAIALSPSAGNAWWGLADLKTFRFEAADIETMEAQLLVSNISNEDRIRLHFSLGKAYADQKLYEKSFGHYAKANAFQRLTIKHDPDLLTGYVTACKQVFTTDLFRARIGAGNKSADPIFIVGMQRSGSTLVEQILASHSRIEGTRELYDLAAVSRYAQTELAAAYGTNYPQTLEKLSADELQSLGERYLAGAQLHRTLGRPFFTDKMGANFVHTGLIQLILPNAKIVDVRRHPMACGFSIFAQLLPKGDNHAYRLADIGRVYRDYVELMAHFARVLPGKVHRLFYEDLIANPEITVRRLLDYLNLPFEPACLEFHKTERVVTTASSQQVRSPIYRDALEQWRHFEPWLGPLEKTLGNVLTNYPEVPEEFR